MQTEADGMTRFRTRAVTRNRHVFVNEKGEFLCVPAGLQRDQHCQGSRLKYSHVLFQNTLSHSVDLNAVAQQLRCVLLLLRLRRIHAEYRLFVSGACGTLRASRLTVCSNWLTVYYNPRAIPVTKVEHPKCRSLPA